MKRAVDNGKVSVVLRLAVAAVGRYILALHARAPAPLRSCPVRKFLAARERAGSWQANNFENFIRSDSIES
jgi:hypothetical protein